MKEFKITIKKPLLSMLAHLNKFYYKINLDIKKHKIINELYEPKLNEKVRINIALCKNANDIKAANLKLNSKINNIDKENISLQKKINLMQELIVRK